MNKYSYNSFCLQRKWITVLLIKVRNRKKMQMMHAGCSKQFLSSNISKLQGQRKWTRSLVNKQTRQRSKCINNFILNWENKVKAWKSQRKKSVKKKMRAKNVWKKNQPERRRLTLIASVNLLKVVPRQVFFCLNSSWLHSFSQYNQQIIRLSNLLGRTERVD